MEPNAAIEWFNGFLDTNLAKALLLPLGYGGFRFVEYLVKRKAEGAGESRDMAALHSAADLHDKLSRQQMSLDDLKAFRQQALGKSAQSASDTAQHYIERAEFLAHAGDAELTANWPEASTQAEMNFHAAEQFTMAEDELASLIIEKMAGYGAEEAAAFQQAQDSWRAWRAAEAEWESKIWEGGSIRPLMVSTKLEQLTRERIATIHLAGDLQRNPNDAIVTYKKAPRDLPEHIEPGITGARVREIIGVPHYISGNRWYYRFQETQLELDLDAEVVTEVTFALVEGQTYEASIGGYERFAFGSLTFGDLLELDPQLEIKHRFSVRTSEIYASMRIGPAGAWSEYYFGAIVPASGGGKLLNTEFDWDWENQKLKSFPAETVINWFGQTHDIEDAPAISWFLR
jgi:uncharacterized protein YecT (DUF1311 family)